MAIRVALNHVTRYSYDRLVGLSPHVVRLRPAPHCRTPVVAYSLRVSPEPHFLNWQQDPFGNYQARLVFPEPAKEMVVEVDLVVEMTVINPFDFFLEKYAEQYPFVYEPALKRDLAPYLEKQSFGPLFAEFVERARSQDARPGRRMVDVLVDLNRRVQSSLRYDIRMEPGVFAPSETLERGHGSCRDFAWLLVQILRHLGLAARFVSGYSIQLKPDEKAIDGPVGVSVDSTDLHAWTEVFLPGAGWVGLDATSGLMAGEGHIPLACTPDPETAAAVSGSFDWSKRGEDDEIEQGFGFSMSVHRVLETPRVTLPYDEAQWNAIQALGREVDGALEKNDVRLTMGGEPTFVAADDPDGDEWSLSALGPTKRSRATELLWRLYPKFTPGALVHEGQGKWYPGEPLPRWALSSYFRKDGVPIWRDPSLFARAQSGNQTDADALAFVNALATKLAVDPKYALPAFEDAWYYLWRERRLPDNVDPFDSKLEDEMERKRLHKVFDQGLTKIVGYTLPLWRAAFGPGTRWQTGRWFIRPERMYLTPGDSPMGFRLPLDSLPWAVAGEIPRIDEVDPFAPRAPLPSREALSVRGRAGLSGEDYAMSPRAGSRGDMAFGAGSRGPASRGERGQAEPRFMPHGETQPRKPDERPTRFVSDPGTVRTALCVEPRDGVLHVFMPPLADVIDYLELCAVIEDTAAELGKQVRLEGYYPPNDPRVSRMSITPDPGVIEVNVHPVANWEDLVNNTTVLYEEARQCRLRAEKFMLDGRHTGTGGGNHVVLGGETAGDSPILRRPDLLRSLVAYWLNHPALSFMFSGMFVGSTSQSPRVDEARLDSVYELDIAFRQLQAQTPPGSSPPPWLVDRIFRNLLIDVTGNTHRTEFCIDKLYSPDSASGRLGLVELRSFEMPPHSRMSLTQQLLVRALVAKFWERPYLERPVRWATELHDRFSLPHFVREDFDDVLDDLGRSGFRFDPAWFAPHHEFRFPLLGHIDAKGGVVLELRQAIEPWNVLGEEATGGGTARYVDSSVERLEVKVRGMVDDRHIVSCNGRRVPLHPTGANGEFVAGVRYRAWNPPSALHPTVGVHVPLVFDVVDRWNERPIAGCTYHVAHPGGLSHQAFPTNSFEAETRRGSRFYRFGHSPGTRSVPPLEPNPQFPMTLDLRR